MKANKSLVLGTVLAAAGIGVCMTSGDAKADTVYTVQKGDTLYKISRKFAGDASLVQAIVEKNNIANPNMIFVGEKVTIPENANDTKSVKKSTNTYKSVAKAQTVKATPKAVKATPKATAPKQQNTYQAPKQNVAPQQTYQAPKQQQTYQAPKQQNTYQAPQHSGSEASAKSWIAMKESTNNYNARNGRYIGKYQLDAAYLNGDYSAANQERVAERYVKQRYGSWSKAKAFHEANGWY
ncbi:LysM peptidoglycan-binding domain-containing protein [Catellicoccus marimammalium]|uniref:Aggregation promoting factor n=1 Tax=Catellicoccus marimammalium M35/04/3 TaxID=1234409 RepID=K8Z954_9ENTE|nr:LysM peptidoglycan-binding domain-containing protein [Catellicoccus marimammalium]EKU27415.1 Aggregation promoting factor [Catellicoccus marimammalium M35/04/3]